MNKDSIDRLKTVGLGGLVVLLMTLLFGMLSSPETSDHKIIGVHQEDYE